MSTAAPTLGPRGQAPGSLGNIGRSWTWPSVEAARLLRRVPADDWITFGLLGLMLVAVGWSVQLAKWGDLPSILPTLLLGWAAGFIASRSGLPLALKLVIALAIGFGIVMWQGSIPAEGTNVADRARDAWERFWIWIAAAREGGVSNDSVPFALMFMTASWITAYTVTSLTFRVRNPWTPVVLLSVGLMSNLSFRPGLHEQTFFIFIIAAIALFAHITAVRRMERWAANGVSYPKSLGWLSMSDGLLFGGIVVLFVIFLPVVEPRSSTLDRAWEVLRAPINALQDPATRLLSGVKAKDASGGLNQPGEVLTFRGAITLTDEPLAWVTSRYATMLPGRVYDQYASTGWLATPEIKRSVGAREELVPVPLDQSRERIEQLVQPLVNTSLVLPAGGVFSVDRDAEVEYLRPAIYNVPLTGPVGSLATLPGDVRDLAFDTRFALRDIAARAPDARDVTLNNQPLMSEADVLAALESGLPGDVEVRLNMRRDGLVEGLTVERIGPEEQVGVVMREAIQAERLYTVTTYVSIAEDDELRGSGADYPGWVEDRYLSLPASLPLEVRLLANQIVRAAGAVTPYEKTRAIQTFLQQQEYSLEIQGPAANQDGVYYFLFETHEEPCPSDNVECDQSRIKGYSQYFGSAGTVLLRAAGVPARMVAGWAAGEYVSRAGKFLIRDKDRHGWTQAYFDGFGWVDVEVTPGRAEPVRNERFSVEPASAGGLPDLGAFAEEDDLFLQDLLDLEVLARLAREQALQRQLADENAGRSFPFQYIVVPLVIAGVVLLIYGGWQFWHRGMTPAERAYTKMVRAGNLLGVRRRRWQTPTEFAMAIGDVAPGVADSAMTIAIEFERRRYAPPDTESIEDGLSRHWRRVLRGLLGYRAHVIGGAGPEIGEGRSSA